MDQCLPAMSGESDLASKRDWRTVRLPGDQLRRLVGKAASIGRWLVIATATVMTTCAQPADAAPLTPAEHADFSYYTFALTWQPGICRVDEGCLADQPKSPLIGLHGLWASLPQTLIAQGIAPRQWWQRGCDFFQHSDAAPALDAGLQQRLDDVMPHFSKSLLTHEYDKHVQCFGFDPTQFFSTELAMRQAVVDSAFGDYLMQRAGRSVAHTEIVDVFRAAFATPAAASLQLQCGHDAAGQAFLTQIWLTILSSRVADFPRADSLIDAPIAQDNCPSTFRIPSWTSPP